MSEVINACVLLIGCRVADVRLIINSLTNDVQTRLIVEDVTKLSEGLERIAKGGVRAVIVDSDARCGIRDANLARAESYWRAVGD
jgi:hypothetical protein